MKVLSDGSANSGRPVSPCRSTTHAPSSSSYRTPDPPRPARDREDAVRQVVEPEARSSTTQPQLAQVRQRLGHRAGAEGGEPAAGPARSSSPAVDERAPSRSSSTTTTSSTAAPSKARGSPRSTLRKPWCSKPSSPVCRTALCSPAVHLNGVSRSSAASIQPASMSAGGNAAASRPAGAELQPQPGLGRRRRPRPASRPRPAVAGSSTKTGHSVSTSSVAATTRRTLPAGSSRSRTAISIPARVEPELRAQPRPDRPADRRRR